MIDVLKKRWRYFTAKTDSRFEANADPKVQLEQAIADAQEQHRRLVEQAANVVANQKQHELQLNRAMEELEKVNGSTRQALLMAEDASKRGDADKAREYNQTAEAFANRLIATENQVNDLKTLSLQSAQAADQARAAVQQNSLALQQKLAERQKLHVPARPGQDAGAAQPGHEQPQPDGGPATPRRWIRCGPRSRPATPRPWDTSELSGQTVEARMLEVQQAAMGSEARSRLDTMRAELGLPSQRAAAPLGAGSDRPNWAPARLRASRPGGSTPPAATPADEARD